MNLLHPSDARRQIEELQQELIDKRKLLRDLRRTFQPEPVTGVYTFRGPNGATATLAELFGDRRELIMIHNMGKGCHYCTLWADGINGLTQHFENRAAFVVVSPDPPEIQQEFAESRGWQFTMWSSGKEFLKEMKMADEHGSAWPGVSNFLKQDDGVILRTGYDYFGPGDDYCAIWHVLDLFPEGPGGWEPKQHYDR